jgi:hypothetical protein
MKGIARIHGAAHVTALLAGTLLTASGVAAAVVPIQGQGVVERPIGAGVYPGVSGVVNEAFFEAHAGRDGTLWILDRQTGRVRSCAPPDAVDQPPRCSPWSP